MGRNNQTQFHKFGPPDFKQKAVKSLPFSPTTIRPVSKLHFECFCALLHPLWVLFGGSSELHPFSVSAGMCIKALRSLKSLRSLRMRGEQMKLETQKHEPGHTIFRFSFYTYQTIGVDPALCKSS